MRPVEVPVEWVIFRGYTSLDVIIFTRIYRNEAGELVVIPKRVMEQIDPPRRLPLSILLEQELEEITDRAMELYQDVANHRRVKNNESTQRSRKRKKLKGKKV